MAKPKRRKKDRPRRSDHPLQTGLQRARKYLDTERPDKAVELLEPLQERYPGSAELYRVLAEAYDFMGELYQAAECYERAFMLSPKSGDILPLLFDLYANMDMPLHALRLSRQLLERSPEDVRFAQVCGLLEARLQEQARLEGVSWQDLEEGSYQIELSQRLIERGDFEQALTALNQAIERVPDWLPPRLLLPPLLSLVGRPEESAEQALMALELDPHHAIPLCQMVRFHALSGRPEEAYPYWERLLEIPVPEEDLATCVQVAEAAAHLDLDAEVYRLLAPALSQVEEAMDVTESFGLRLLAVASANLGYWEEAEDYCETLLVDPDQGDWAEECLDTLMENQPGPGWHERYPYFDPGLLISFPVIEEVFDLLDIEETEPDAFRRRMDELARGHPQLVRVAEYMIWGEMDPGTGIAVLQALATPRAIEMLRRFALGRAGPEDARIDALYALLVLGALDMDEPVHFWREGKWQEITLRDLESIERPDWPYDPGLYPLMEQAFSLGNDGHYEEAVRLYLEMLSRDPAIKEACNNLAGMYTFMGEDSKAKEMFLRAVELDPLYLFPRCNLAGYALREDDLQQAKAWIAPLGEQIPQYTAAERVQYYMTQAQIASFAQDYELANLHLERVLEIDPQSEEALELQSTLQLRMGLSYLLDATQQLAEQQQESIRRRNERIRSDIKTPDASLEQILSVYTKDALVGMAREVIPARGWSTLHKAELIAEIQRALLDRDNLARVVAKLLPEAVEALGVVLEAGGSMAGAAFLELYGDDLDESPYWNWHWPKKVTGQLRACGLLAVGVVRDQLQVWIPLELRDFLRDLLPEG